MPHSHTEASYYLKSGEREKQLVERRESMGREEGGGWGGGEGREKAVDSMYQSVAEKGRGKERGVEVLRGASRRINEEVEERNQHSDMETGSRVTEIEERKEKDKLNSSPTRESDMIIHVFDDQRKSMPPPHKPLSY